MPHAAGGQLRHDLGRGSRHALNYSPRKGGASVRLLSTKTGFSPYGHVSKVKTVSKVWRPMTRASTVANRRRML
jgi:hypothetical protein